MPDITYSIAGRIFTQEELTLLQIKWIKKRLSSYPIFSMTKESAGAVIIDESSAMLAICLIPDGMTRKQKMEAGWSAVEELEAWFDINATPEEVANVVVDFFRLNHAILKRVIPNLQGHMGTFGAGLTTPSSL